MVALRSAAVPALFAIASPGQAVEWLQPVSRLTIPAERALVAALAPDGKCLATIGVAGTVRVIDIESWREHRRWQLPESTVVDDAFISADGETLVLRLPRAAGANFRAFCLGDGATTTVPTFEVQRPESLPPEGLQRLFPRATAIRTSTDGKSAMFRHDDQLLLWRGNDAHRLDRHVEDVVLTGDGRHAVLQLDDGVRTQPIAGGDAWIVPDIGMRAVVAPFGAGSTFVAVDPRHLVAANAETRAVVRRCELAKLGVTMAKPRIVAMRPDGKHALIGSNPFGAEAAGWLVDLDAATCARLPCAPIAATWVHDGWLVHEGRQGPCVTAVVRSYWINDSVREPEFTPWQQQPCLVDLPMNLPAIARSGEVLLPAMGEPDGSAPRNDGAHVLLVGRFAARTGERRASLPVAGDAVAAVVVKAEYVLSLESGEQERIDLHRLADHALIATMVWHPYSHGPLLVRTAEHAPRVLLHSREGLEVFDVVPPAAAKK